MSKNKLILFTSLGIFVCLMVYALWRELDRNEKQIGSSISGVIRLSPGIGAGIVKTDNAHILLIDPETLQPVAINTLNPFVPPLTFHIGQEHVLGNYQLQGAYRLLVISDKDGRLGNPSSGEVMGEVSEPLPLSTEGYQYVLTKPFRQWPQELQTSSESQTQENSSSMIQGKVMVSAELKAQVSESDRIIVMLFDPKLGRPVAMKIIPQFRNNQTFSIGQAQAMPGQTLKGDYSLRIITDKDNQPFNAAPGEIVGRSSDLVPLGTKDLEFVLDQKYVR
ncbi:MAG: hypothetical protein HQM13_16070 [SAR324 cluster bacterium]|nr:hypothetical protein [SAR324 cluster bacterium]